MGIIDDVNAAMERDENGKIVGHGYWEFNACYGFGATPGPCQEFGCGRPEDEHARWARSDEGWGQ